MRVLVTGGAGYIGSVIVARLAARGHDVVVYDDLSRGHAAAVPDGVPLVAGDVRDAAAVRDALVGAGCEAIVHMAALAEVAESVGRAGALPRRERRRDGGRDRGGARPPASAASCSARRPPCTARPAHADRRGRPPRADQPVRRDQARRRSACCEEARVARRPRRHRPALLQRLRRRRRLRRGPRPRDAPHPARAARRPRRRRRSASSATTTRRPTAPACATTSTSPTSRTRTSPRSRRCPASRARSTWGRARATRCWRVLDAVEAVTGLRLLRETAARRAGDPPVARGEQREGGDGAPAGVRGAASTDAVADAWAWMREHPDGYAER